MLQVLKASKESESEDKPLIVRQELYKVKFYEHMMYKIEPKLLSDKFKSKNSNSY